jgi:hypothetical protein
MQDLHCQFIHKELLFFGHALVVLCNIKYLHMVLLYKDIRNHTITIGTLSWIPRFTLLVFSYLKKK